MTGNDFNAQVGRQQFLNLLVTQLQHQDPLEPVGQEDFLQQLAQFSVVEGIENLNLKFADMLKMQQLTDGAGLVGQHVRYQPEDSSQAVEGLVSEVRIDEGQLLARIGSDEVPLDRIHAVIAAPAASA